LTNLVLNKRGSHALFQILLLNNDSDQDVEVQEAEQVNFFRVKEHLKNGGSVFITSKDSQKILYSKAEAQLNYSRSRKNYGALPCRRVRGS